MGLIMAVFEPTTPATIPTPGAVFDSFVKTSPSWVFVVPAFIEVGSWLAPQLLNLTNCYTSSNGRTMKVKLNSYDKGKGWYVVLPKNLLINSLILCRFTVADH